MKLIEYKERMRFKHPAIFIFLMLVLGLFLFAVVQQTFFKVPIGDEYVSESVLFLITGTAGAVLLLFVMMWLKLKINEKGIHYRFFPIHFAYHTIAWEDIEEVNVLKNRVVKKREAPTSGYTRSVYSIGTKAALEIFLHDNSVIYISTRNPGKAEEYVMMYKRKSSKERFKDLL